MKVLLSWSASRAGGLTLPTFQKGSVHDMVEWERLFAKAYPGFHLGGGHKPPESAMWIWLGEGDYDAVQAMPVSRHEPQLS